jgi:hypothetical protein
MRVWQIATGESGRDYRELFFNHDLMILGPSHKGDALLTRYSDGISNSAGSQVQSFAVGPIAGDRVLMRFGRDVIGVGEIPSEDDGYAFDRTFRSVYGWDLCHRRRVKWATNLELGLLATVYHKAKQKPSFTQVHDPEIVQAVGGIDNEHFVGPLGELPSINAELYQEDELGVELFRAGISNNNIDAILAALRQAERLHSWYWFGGSGRFPTEHEVVSHIVLPLFLGLGWSHQQIAVEWNKVDMAFFKRTPRANDTCVMILEAKGLGRGLGDVLSQPREYARTLGLDNVKHIVTTDGANLFMFERSGSEWNPDPVGYFSIASLQHEYVLPKGTNIIDTLVRLQPNAM